MTEQARIWAAVNRPGDVSRESEDRVGGLGRTVWAIDGATSSGIAEGFESFSVQWLVNLVETTLVNNSPRLSPSELVAAAAIRISEALDAASFPATSVPPSCAIAILQIDAGRVEWAVLGDVVIALGNDLELVIVTDEALGSRELEVIRARAEMSHDELRAFLTQRRNRDMNREGGYWVLSRGVESAKHVISGVIDMGSNLRFAIATDGFSRSVDLFKFETWQTILGKVGGDPSALDHIVDRVRAVEEEDADLSQYPRVKKSDDAAAIAGVFVEIE